MNSKKFEIIVCVNNDELWAECKRHLDSLMVPEGYSLSVTPIRGARNIAAAYNSAMLNSDAKYKIYLHQDTFVLNTHILDELLKLFTKPEIGMVGMQGGTRLPKNGIWFYDGFHSYGTIMRIGVAEGLIKKLIPARLNRRRIRKFSYLPILRPYLPVICIDGLFMATQYDIHWREDLFGGFIYYEAPHCLEFMKQNYLVVIPRQTTPWCLHVGANRTPEEDRVYHEEFKKNLKMFCEEYSWAIGKSIRQLLKK